MRIDLPGVEAFLAVAEHASFRRAAAEMNLSQAALSHRVKKLEEALGTALLARTTRRVALTEAGLALLPVARRTVADMGEALRALRDQGRDGPDRLAVGCLPTLALLHLPAVLAEFHRLRQHVRVQVYDNSADEIAARVRAGQADFGLTVAPIRKAELDFAPLSRDPFVLVCPASHRLSGRPAVRWDELHDEKMIRISAEAANRVLIDAALDRKRETLRWQFEAQRVPTAIGLVRAGLGLTVLPRSGLDADGAPDLVGIALRHPSIARPLGLLSLRDRPLPPHAALLATMVSKRLRPSGGRSGQNSGT